MSESVPWRLVVGRESYAEFSVAVSPAVEEAVVAGTVPPTIFLDIFESDSITIGVNEDPEQVLDLAYCRANGIDFRRRVNGGGAVYAGAGGAFLVLYLPTSHPCVPDTAAAAFPHVLTKVAECFAERWKIPAAYRPLNDIEVAGRKMVPTSLKIENGVMTFRIVINVTPIDLEVAGKALPMPPEKVQDKVFKDLASRFTCLETEVGRKIEDDELIDFAHDVARHAFGEAGLVTAPLSAAEQAGAERFRARFDTDDWLYGKTEARRIAPLRQAGDQIGRGRAKAVGGMIWATLLVRDGTVAHAVINGDWHPRPIEAVAWLEQALLGARAIEPAMALRVTEFLARPEVEFAGVEATDLTAALNKALASLAPA